MVVLGGVSVHYERGTPEDSVLTHKTRSVRLIAAGEKSNRQRERERERTREHAREKAIERESERALDSDRERSEWG